MNILDTREWLLTNGLGSFACGTVCDARTRTYHGWLIAALEPPCQRRLFLSHLEASLEIDGCIWQLNTNFWQNDVVEPAGFELLDNFTVNPIPTWLWRGDNWQMERLLLMPHQDNSILVNYQYQGLTKAILNLRPLIADRDFHHQQHHELERNFSSLEEDGGVIFASIINGQKGTQWRLDWSAGEYINDGFWYHNYYYPEEANRGLGDREDLYSPGLLKVHLNPGDSVTIKAVIGCKKSILAEEYFTEQLEKELNRRQTLISDKSIIFEQHNSLVEELVKAGDQFIVYRSSIDSPTIIAGYPWFNDWGRDTLISLPGLTLYPGRLEIAKGLLKTFGKYCKFGLIPNSFPDQGNQPFYNSIDAPLWWVEILGLYLEASQDWQFLKEQYPVWRQIYKAFNAGTIYNIGVDASDGLLMWDAPGVALTWMDAVLDGVPITPRRGKPVEINALWYSALCWAEKWAHFLELEAEQPVKYQNQALRYAQQARKVKQSLQNFYNFSLGYLYDVIAIEGHRDSSVRPNAVIALSLQHCGFTDEQGKNVLVKARDRLLTPYGLRSLDPADPAYIGRYGGSRWMRDQAYHQGTVWTWLIGPFVRAWGRFYPEQPLPFNWQPLLTHFRQAACLHSVSEIFDGDAPHSPQGAFAQAWSVAELLRHYPTPKSAG